MGYQAEYCSTCDERTLRETGACPKCSTAEDCGTQPASAQQLKPKMPSFEEVLKDAVDTSVVIASPSSFIAGLRFMYEYIARHFGH